MSVLQTSHTLPTRSGPGFSVSFPGFQPEGAASVPLLFPDQLECLDLAQGFGHMPAHGRSENLVCLDHPLRIDDEPAPVFDARIFIIDTVRGPDLASSIGKHGEGYTSLDHFRQFLVIPHLVHEDAVYAHRQNLHAELPEILITSGDRRYFRRSNEGEVTRIKAQDDPFTQMLRQFHGGKLALAVSRSDKIRSRFSHLDHFPYLLYGLCFLLWLDCFRLSDQATGRTRTANLRFFRPWLASFYR